MSADEILASSLWPWPDPLLKRDQAGLVLFVNAAFLQLYGGQVQDWCAKPLAGWPAPAKVGAQRFETRIGTDASENVYDWVESTMADGNALAIARNVTVFKTAPIPQMTETAPPASAASKPTSQIQEPLKTPTPEPAFAQITEPTPPPPEPAQSQPEPELACEYESALDKRADEFAYTENQVVSAAPQSAVVAPPVADQISQQAQPQLQPQQQEETRMMERRALPIEDTANVLGSNWRDDVIAKAVGDSDIPEEIAGDNLSGKKVSEKPAEGLLILLAEDNAINALLTRTLLEAEGAEVDTVEDGALALEAVGKKTYDLIFMDMRMPNMDGLESTRKIRAFGFEGPIIALTANAFDDDRNACFDSGMNDFMTKPVSAEELSEMVDTWTKPEEQKKLAS